MISLYVISWIIFIVTLYRLYKKANYNINEINPFEGNFFEFMGFIFGATITSMFTIYLIIRYLP